MARVSETQRASCKDGRSHRGAIEKGATLAMLSEHVESEYGALKKRAQAIVGSADPAADVVQSVLAETTASIGRGHKIYNLDAWLNTSIRYKAFRSLRRSLTLPLDSEVPNAGYKTTAEIAHLKSGCEAVYKAIDELLPDQKRAFLLSELHGMSSTEIAYALDRKPAAIRQLLTRARRNVRQSVGPDVAPSVTPIMQLHARTLITGGSEALGARQAIATRLADIFQSAAAIFDRWGVVVNQPYSAIVIGTAIIVALGIGSPADSGRSSERPVAGGKPSVAVGYDRQVTSPFDGEQGRGGNPSGEGESTAESGDLGWDTPAPPSAGQRDEKKKEEGEARGSSGEQSSGEQGNTSGGNSTAPQAGGNTGGGNTGQAEGGKTDQSSPGTGNNTQSKGGQGSGGSTSNPAPPTDSPSCVEQPCDNPGNGNTGGGNQSNPQPPSGNPSGGGSGGSN